MALNHTQLVLRTYRSKVYLLRRYKAKVGCACGEKRPECLDLHHRDPATKNPKMNVKWRTARWHDLSYEDLVAEVFKCDVMCSNCHRVHHAQDLVPRQEKFSPKRRAAEIALGLIEEAA